MTNTTKHYAKRDPESQGAHYINHVYAMTTEGLHATRRTSQLAHSDIEIERLRAALATPAQEGWCDGCSPDNCGGCVTPASPAQAGEYPAGTGNPDADRIICRLASSDPDFDDCADAVVLIHKLVAEIKGPDGYATWKDVAVAERVRRVEAERMLAARLQAAHAQPAAMPAAPAQAVPTSVIMASVMRDDGGVLPAFCLTVAYRAEKDAMTALAMLTDEPAQQAAPAPTSHPVAVPEPHYGKGRYLGFARYNDAYSVAQVQAMLSSAPNETSEYPPLECDYCGAPTPDPWHSSGMMNGKMSKHIHSCDACAARGITQAAPIGIRPTARIRYERNTPGRENEMPRVVSCNRLADGIYEVFTAAQVQAMLAAKTQPTTE